MNTYLEKHRFCDPQLKAEVNPDLGLVVVIPCYNEPELNTTLESLNNCHTGTFHAEVIIVINHSENESEIIKQQNHSTFKDAQKWIKNNSNSGITFHLIQAYNLPHKKAGVGLARKIGMDEAVYRLDQLNNSDGIIVCVDADCKVEQNYLTEIIEHFKQNPSCPACHLNYSHVTEEDHLSHNQIIAIAIYELYLRWYKLNLEYCNHPYAYFTIGSCIAVKSKVYQKQGGMNNRKAGEDFYFLQKIFPLDNFMELNSTCVYPSARYSDRVPFGTGAFLNLHKDEDMQQFKTFNPELFAQLRQFISLLPDIYENKSLLHSNLFPILNKYLESIHVDNKLDEIISNSTDFRSFRKRFFRWFNGLLVLQYLHFGQAYGITNVSLMDSCNLLLKQIDYEGFTNKKNPLTLLKTYRQIQRLNRCEKPSTARF